MGGLGSAVCEVVAEGHPAHVRRVGLRDTFACSGRDWQRLLAHYHIDHLEIEKQARELVYRDDNRTCCLLTNERK